MVRIVDGIVVREGLPETGELSDGTTVSGYPLLPPQTLADEGWLPLEDIPPSFNPITQFLEASGYMILPNKVVKQYIVVTKEPSEIETLKKAINALLLQISLTPEQMLELIDIYDPWSPGMAAIFGKCYRYQGSLYKTITAHPTQANWTPDISVSLFTKVMPEGVIGEWVRPTGAHDAYQTGDKVTFNGAIYESNHDANTYSPTEYAIWWTKL